MATKKTEKEPEAPAATQAAQAPADDDAAGEKKEQAEAAPAVAAKPPTSTAEAKKPNPILAKIKPVTAFQELARIKMLILGPSGGGKSTLAATFQRPLIGLTEKQAIPSIRQANPHAAIFPITTMEDLEQFQVLAASPRLGDNYDAIVLDSLTDAQRIIRDALTGQQTKRTDITDQDTWGVVVDKTARVARVVRDAVVNTVLVTLDQEIVMPDVGIVHRPAVSGKKLPNELQQYVNAVGFVRKVMTPKGKRHEVVFDAGPNYATKGMRGLRSVEPPEAAWLLHQVFGTPVPDDVAARVQLWEEMGEAAAAAVAAAPKGGDGAFD